MGIGVTELDDTIVSDELDDGPVLRLAERRTPKGRPLDLRACAGVALARARQLHGEHLGMRAMVFERHATACGLAAMMRDEESEACDAAA